MFTGIIKETGKIKSVVQTEQGRETTIFCNLAKQVEIDQSININGVCHTVVAVDGRTFSVQTVKETMRKTNIGELKENDAVNLEPSLHPEQLLDGHIVQGHTDTVGKITQMDENGADRLITISFPKEYRDLLVERGSITVDGISLTIAHIQQDAFTVAIIPFTYENTNMQNRRAGDEVNLEFDVIGKYVARYMENRQ